MTRTVVGLTASVILSLLAAPAGAGELRPLLGMTVSQVKMIFPSAQMDRRYGAQRSLILSNVTYASTHWDKVVMRFDDSGRLETVRLEEHGAAYEDVRSRIYDQMNRTLSMKVETGFDVEPDGAQYRLCQSSDGTVALTLERPSVEI